MPKSRFLRLAVLLPLLAGSQCWAENLARDAAYSAVISGFVYRGQLVPGTNTPATVDGFMDAPLWRGPADCLIDGRRDGDAVVSWFWSNMPKRITVTFDLRRPAKISGLRIWPREGSNTGFDSATMRVSDTLEGLSTAPETALAPVEGAFSWRGNPLTGRWLRVICGSSAPEMTLAEVEIEGEAAGPVVADAPKPGPVPVPARDLTPLITLPAKAAGVTNLAARGATKITVTSRHYDDKVGAWVDDTCARDSDPTGRALLDGNPATAANSFSGWYAAKSVTAELDLGQPCEIARIVVWSAGHGGPAHAYLNAFQLWAQAGPGAPWMPLGETRNPLLPGEKPGPEYPITSVPHGAGNAPVIAQRLRLQCDGVAQSADLVRVGEIEVWGKAVVGAVNAVSWRVKRPVPQIAPVHLGKLPPAYDWITHDRIRALYGYSDQSTDTALLDRAAAVGFNSFIFHTSGPQGHSEAGWQAICAAWAKVQAERKLRVIVSWPFGSDERYGNTQFGAYQPGGRERWTRTPCPLSEEYWNRVVGDRAVVAARAGLTGLVVDMEMYGGDSTRYPGPCYCDRCWGGFVHEHLEGVQAEDIALADRPAWIAGNGLTADYARRQELEVMRILRGLRERVRAVRGDFLLGNLLDPESLPGLARGLGTPTMPTLIFSELEYRGNITGVAGRVAQLRNLGYPALYVAGFWPQPVLPQDLPHLIRDGAPQCAGYWVWCALAYDDKTTGEYAHNKDYTAEDYWKATKLGNELLKAGGAAAGAKSIAGPKAVVPRVQQAPVGDADWTKAVMLRSVRPGEPGDNSFVDHNNGGPAKGKTTARALWDGKRLYLRLRCEEPTPDNMTPLRGARDDSNLWTQDSVEVFWMRPGGAQYAHVIVNAAGTVADALADGLKPEDQGWNADISSQTWKTDGGWGLDLAIPLDADGLGGIAPGGEVRFEIARNRPGGGETTCWAPVHGMFKAATELWGTLKLQ